MTDDHFQNSFTKLGKEWQLTDDIFKVLEEITDICDVNDMRYELFRVKNGNL